MSTSNEEFIAEKLDRDRIRQRADDWQRRIDSLYETLESWLPQGWTAERHGHVTMSESLMDDVGEPPRQLPVLELARDGEMRVIVRPYGLWIIGANGRLDVIKGSELFFITDAAPSLATPKWRLSSNADRSKTEALTQPRFRKLLR